VPPPAARVVAVRAPAARGSRRGPRGREVRSVEGVARGPPLVTTSIPPPQTPHVASPASRLGAACFGGRPDSRPLSKRTARPSTSARRDAPGSRAPRSRCGGARPACGPTPPGPGLHVHLAPVVTLPPAVPDGDPVVDLARQNGPHRGRRPAIDGRQVRHRVLASTLVLCREYFGAGARSAVSRFAMALSPRPEAYISKMRSTTEPRRARRRAPRATAAGARAGPRR
jgi:hypothetical protein